MEPSGIGRSISVRHGFFDWINSLYVDQCKEPLYEAVHHWFDQYPIGYTDVAVRYGIRPSTLFSAIKRADAKQPEQLCPKRINFRDVRTTSAPGKFSLVIEKLSDIPVNRPLSPAERKTLFEELEDAKTRRASAEFLLEIVAKGCRDSSKKGLQRQLELTR